MLEAIVPVYLKSGDKDNVASVLAGFPRHSRAIVVSQGLEPSIPDDSRFELVHSTKPLGKWGAVKKANKELSFSGPIVIIDGDGAFPGNSTISMASKIESGAMHAIGSRKAVVLSSDPTANRNRIFVECYFNTLAMLLSGLSPKPIDIQCGLHAFSPEHYKSFDWGRVPDGYGGELELAAQSMKAGVEIAQAPVETASNPSSIQDITPIINSLLKLPSLSGATKAIMKKAMELCPRVYGNRISDENEFRDFITSRLGI